MSFVTTFANDVFISYSHIDNEDKWVDRFGDRLQLRLAQLLGEKVAIWRSFDLRGTERLPGEVFQSLRKTAVLAVVLTPAYLASGSSGKELADFLNFASSSSPAGVGAPERVVKIVRVPVENREEPEPLKNLVGVTFYGRGESLRSFTELSAESQEFSIRMDTVAQRIAGVLRLLRAAELGQHADRAEDEEETVHGQTKPVDDQTKINNDEAAAIFKQLSPSSLDAIANADGMRRAVGQRHIHMEHLVAGLLRKKNGPTEILFRAVEIDASTLGNIVQSSLKTTLPSQFAKSSLSTLPPLSKHVLMAFRIARDFGRERGDSILHSRYLLYGALSVGDCTLVKALLDRGVRKENIPVKDDVIPPV